MLLVAAVCKHQLAHVFSFPSDFLISACERHLVIDHPIRLIVHSFAKLYSYVSAPIFFECVAPMTSWIPCRWGQSSLELSTICRSESIPELSTPFSAVPKNCPTAHWTNFEKKCVAHEIKCHSRAPKSGKMSYLQILQCHFHWSSDHCITPNINYILHNFSLERPGQYSPRISVQCNIQTEQTNLPIVNVLRTLEPKSADFS